MDPVGEQPVQDEEMQEGEGNEAEREEEKEEFSDYDKKLNEVKETLGMF